MLKNSSFLFSLILAFGSLAVATPSVPWYEVPDLSQFDHLDTKNSIPELAKKKALAYYEMYKDKIPNKNYITIFDASAISGKPRLHVIHIPTGTTESFLVAHGKGSDSNHDGYAEKFSNQLKSNATSLGFYITDATYTGGNGYSLKLKGLESTNSNAYGRAIVVHGASYVDSKMANTLKKVGRSQGCPAVENKYARYVIDRIKNGSVFYIWTP
tara:strand:+ start:162007 stop:162645 length:639 start_codon:yes stop_codon:yes gene_type:complete